MMAQQLLTDDHLKVKFHDSGLCYKNFWCWDDFSGLWSQLRVGPIIGYILHLNFHRGNRSGLNKQAFSY